MHGIKLEIEDLRLKNKVRTENLDKAQNAAFRIKFTEPLDKITVTDTNIRITDKKGNGHVTGITYDENSHSVILRPKSPYETNADYFLVIGVKVASDSGKRLSSPLFVKFMIEEDKIVLIKALKPDDPEIFALSKKAEAIFEDDTIVQKKKRRLVPLLLLLFILAAGAGAFSFINSQVGGAYIDGGDVFEKYAAQGYKIELLHEYSGTNETRMSYNAQKYKTKSDAYKFYFYNIYGIEVSSIKVSIYKNSAVICSFEVPASMFSGKKVSEVPIFTFDFKNDKLKLHYK